MKKAGIDDTFCRYESKPKIKPKPLYKTTNQKIKKNYNTKFNFFFWLHKTLLFTFSGFVEL